MADRKDGLQWSNYLWFGGQLVGMTRSGVLYQIDNDHLGRPELITKASKAVVWRSNNSPFGGMTPDSANTLTDFNVGFPGQYLDAESGLWYNMNRYYDAELGRYLQADPIGLAGGLNPYVYVRGNPVMHVDPSGHQAAVPVLGAAVVGLGLWYWYGKYQLANQAKELHGNSASAIQHAANMKADNAAIVDCMTDNNCSEDISVLEEKRDGEFKQSIDSLKGAAKDACEITNDMAGEGLPDQLDLKDALQGANAFQIGR